MKVRVVRKFEHLQKLGLDDEAIFWWVSDRKHVRVVIRFASEELRDKARKRSGGYGFDPGRFPALSTLPTLAGEFPRSPEAHRGSMPDAEISHRQPQEIVGEIVRQLEAL
jgi:hypothetical protein